MRKGGLAAALAICGLAGAAAWALSDRRAWQALGPGGLPPTWKGWARVTWLRRSKRDPFDLAIYEAEIAAGVGRSHLGALPSRRGERPTIAPWPIPHRQTDQQGPAEVRQRQDALFARAVAGMSDQLHFHMSHFEKHTAAVTLRTYDAGRCHACLSHGEVAHIHPSDGSMHMILSPQDAQAVIRAGWGERHPLAGTPAFAALPTPYVLIYAPRDEQDLATLEILLAASIDHMLDA